MTNTYVDMGGVENVACAIVRQAKKDFIKGVKYVYGCLGCVPTEKEIYKEHPTLTNRDTVRYMYDSWRFVRDDPYELFSPGEDIVIKAWIDEGLLDYYRPPYIKAGSILYKKKAPKQIQDIPEKDLMDYLQDPGLERDFIKARNYVSKRSDAKEIFHEWNVEAHSQSHKVKIHGKKAAIQESDYFKKAKAKRAKNIERAKELKDAGFSIQAIAADLQVTAGAVWGYLRS